MVPDRAGGSGPRASGSPGSSPGERGAALRLAAGLACLLAALPVGAALRSVSGAPDPAADEVLAGGAEEDVAFSLANGFPLWYRDATGLELQLCDDPHAELTPGVQSTPCLTAEPFLGAPRSFPANFGSEALYWTASAFAAFTSSLTTGGVTQLLAGDALVVLSLEAGFQQLIPIDGEQAVFARIRIRANLPVPGTYRVTHPYGQAVYAVTSLAPEREIDQTQDVGNMPPHAGGAPVPPGGPPPLGDFTLALLDGPAPPAGGFDPSVDQAVVSSVASGIGPFLLPAQSPGGPPLAPIVAASGAVYLADPGSDFAPRTVAVTGSPLGANFLSVELLDPPAGFFLDARGQTQTIVVERFQVAGRIFDRGPNAAPVAVPDAVATAMGAPVTVDVVANDLDPVDPATNRHGIDPRAIGLPSNAAGDPPGTILLTRPLTTENGGTVRRTTTFTTGETAFVYTPAPGFAGTDTFEYVVQDAGGRLSAPATVTVLVEDLAVARAEVRARTGRWRVSGTTSARGANEVTLHAGPRALLSGAGVVPPVASGAATFAVRPEAIDFRLALDRAPASPVTAAHLHLAPPGEDGPVAFFLFDEPVDGPFGGVKRGTLTAARLLFVPERPLLTLADVAAALLAGEAYVDVHTGSFAGGELRGPVASPRIGGAPVDPATGAWSFAGPARVAPGGPPASVTAVSTHGVRATVPLRFR